MTMCDVGSGTGLESRRSHGQAQLFTQLSVFCQTSPFASLHPIFHIRNVREAELVIFNLIFVLHPFLKFL